MELRPGSELSHYRLLAPIGQGGMGVVWKATDTNLGRDVALKTLPADFAADPDRLARFESEAKAIASLSHPNLLAIHDFGTESGVTFAVTELIEGQSLRERLLDGPLAAPRAVAIAVQIAQGLAAAHDRGVIHRDLKPENVMVTHDGRAKILDFGLAKRVSLATLGSQSLAPTMAAMTEPGAVLGTTAYMSPEQVRGAEVDARSDIFSFGVLLYELLAGRRPFEGESAADVMTAILREDPAPLQTLAGPLLERIVLRCLEKHPAARFRSAADLAFALEGASSASSTGSRAASASADSGHDGSRLHFTRITFRNGHVARARYTPDGSAVVYGAAWDGEPNALYTSRIGNPESGALNLPQGSLLAISPSGELAISLGYHHVTGVQTQGTLARVALVGGGVRPLQKHVGDADFAPDGRTMAVVRYHEGRCLLEYPPGQVRIESPEWIRMCRVSPDGQRIAFSQNERTGEGTADLCVLESDGTFRVLYRDMTNLTGIAWRPDGRAVWFSGIDRDQRHGIFASDLEGRLSDVYVSPTRVTVHDVRADGRVLITVDELRAITVTRGMHEERTRDFSWFDGTIATHVSADGSQIITAEVAEAENPHYGFYLRETDGSPAVRLGDGIALSREGDWVLARTHSPEHALWLYPTGFGEPRRVSHPGIERVLLAALLPGAREALVVGTTPQGERALFHLNLESGANEVVWTEAPRSNRLFGLPITPDGRELALRNREGVLVRYDWRARTTIPVPVHSASEEPLEYSTDGSALFLCDEHDPARRIVRLELASGARETLTSAITERTLGVQYTGLPMVSRDGRRFAMGSLRVISNLYQVEGLLPGGAQH